MKLSLTYAVSGIICLPFVNAIGQNLSIAFTGSAGTLKLNGGQILVSANDNWGVQKAAWDLAVDFGRVTGTNLTFAATNATTAAPIYPYRPVTNQVNYTVGDVVNITGPSYTGSRVSLASTVIIAGTIGSSIAIDSLVASGQIDVSAIKGKWESFVTQIVTAPWPGVPRALIIAGSNPRGTIFGIYDISEQIGVSPWYFWADSPPQKHSEIYALNNIKIQGPPSIKYRGIFLNDEQPGLTNWVNNNYPPGKYGAGYDHNFHSHVFELLLRLRANYFWPTTWASMFGVDDTENQPMADAHGIVMGSSHTEPMMRATKEWSNFGTGDWEWDLNNATIYKFFETGARRAKPYKNSLYTMAMRGVGDVAINLSQAYAIQVALEAVKAQKEIIGKVYNGTEAPDQMWCLYKEVQGYYEAGMNVPDDITLLWADDNWGNIRRLPIGNETNRSGGAGVYYHFDYVGDPRNYKWINTIQLEKTLEQMKLAYERKADRIWIVNVGDLKGLELPISHFLDLAYNTPQWGYDSVPQWLELWAAREFGASVASSTAKIMDLYGMLAARRKYELLDASTYSVINYREGDAVLEQWSSLAANALATYNTVAADAQGAYFEMVLHPILAGYTVHKIHLGAKKNRFYTNQKRNSANTVAQNVLADFNMDANLTLTYHRLFNGKWKDIMDQPHLGYDFWQQPMRNAIPPLSYVATTEVSVAGNIGVSVEGSNATIPGDDVYHPNSGNTLALPPMDPYGPSRYIEIFSRGNSGCSWTITPNVSYVTASPSTGYTGGSNGTDYLITLTVDWSKAPAAPNSSVALLKFTSSCNWGNFPTPTVTIPINSVRVATNFTAGFVESDRHISFEAEHTTRNSSVNGVSYMTLKNYGRTLSGVTLTPILATTQAVGAGPVLEYDLYTFTNLTSTLANITLYISPAWNYMSQNRPLRYAIGVDSEVPQVRQFCANYTGADFPDGWVSAVADSVWGLSSNSSNSNTTTSHRFGAPGKHTLRIWELEPGFVVQKVVIDTGGVRGSYLGPPESFLVGRDTVGSWNGSSILG